MCSRTLLPALLLFLSTFLSGETREKTSRHFRMLAVGETPPFRQEIRDGVRYELEPPPGSLPPPVVFPDGGTKSGNAVDLRLGMITERVKVPQGAAPLVLRRERDGRAPGGWLNVGMPETGDFMIYLFRNPSMKTWDGAMGLVVPDGAGTPAGSLRITNLFPQAVRVVLGKEAIKLEKGGSILRKAEPGAESPFRILASDSSGKMICYYSGGVMQNAGERGWVTIYRADGASPRRPLKVSILREPVTKDPEQENTD